MNLQDLDDALLSRAPSRAGALDAAFADYHGSCQRLGLPLLGAVGLPLRPFLLPAAALVDVGRGLRALLHELARLEPEALAPGAAPTLLSQWQAHRSNPGFFHVARPDLRVQRGGEGPARFGVIDLNLGTPVAATALETDLLAELYRRIFSALDLDANAFGHSASVIEVHAAGLARLAPGTERLVALLLPTDAPDAHDFDGQLAGYLERLQAALGVDVVVAAPDDLGPGGALAGAAARADTLLLQLGTSDMANPAVRAALAPLLAVPGIEARWISSPFTSVYEKTLLPRLSALDLDDAVFVPDAFAVEPKTMARLCAEQPQWVMKHGRNLKRVLVGARCSVETWRDAVTLAAHVGEFIAQRRVEQQPTRMPFWRHGRIEHHDVVEELSPFVVDGALVSCFVRFLPVSSPSTVVSPPPADLGLSVAWSLPP